MGDEPEQSSLFRSGSLMQIACLGGLFNVLNGFLIVYASSPVRTPPLIQARTRQHALYSRRHHIQPLNLSYFLHTQAILQNAAVLFSIPCSKLILRDNKQYLSRWPLIACTLVVMSVVVSVLPTILAGQADEGFDSASAFGWIAVYFTGLVPGAHDENTLARRVCEVYPRAAVMNPFRGSI